MWQVAGCDSSETQSVVTEANLSEKLAEKGCLDDWSHTMKLIEVNESK